MRVTDALLIIRGLYFPQLLAGSGVKRDQV